MIPVIGFFVSRSVKDQERGYYVPVREIRATREFDYVSVPLSVPKSCYGNQEVFSDWKPKVRREMSLSSDRKLHL